MEGFFVVNISLFYSLISMKTLRDGASLYFYVTCTEKSTLTNPYWLIRFVSDQTGQEAAALFTNFSNYTDRYDKFLIDPADLHLDSGIHTYYIYEQSSSSNTNYLLATNLCETGQVSIVGTEHIIFSHPTYTVESSFNS